MVEGGTPEILNYLKISLLSVEGRTPEIFYYLKISYQKLFHPYYHGTYYNYKTPEIFNYLKISYQKMFHTYYLRLLRYLTI